MTPPDGTSPIAFATARGLPEQVEAMSPSEASDPLAAASAMRQRAQVDQLRQIEIDELAREQAKQNASARAQVAESQLKELDAEAKRIELQERLDELKNARRVGGDGSGSTLTDKLLAAMLDEQAAARGEAQELRNQMQQQLSAELAAVRAELRGGTAGKDSQRPYELLSEDLNQLKGLLTLVKTMEPSPQIAALGHETQVTIEHLKLQQDFDLRKEQLSIEREERNRKWEEERASRQQQHAIAMAELDQRRKRDQALAGALNDLTPRIAGALSGIQPAPGAPGLPSGGSGLPAGAPEPQGEAGTLKCFGCETPIPISATDTQVICPNPECGRIYNVGRR